MCSESEKKVNQFTTIHFVDVPLEAPDFGERAEESVFQKIDNTILLMHREMRGVASLSEVPKPQKIAYFAHEHILALDLFRWPQVIHMNPASQ